MIFLCGHAPFFMRPSRNEPYRPVVRNTEQCVMARRAPISVSTNSTSTPKLWALDGLPSRSASAIECWLDTLNDLSLEDWISVAHAISSDTSVLSRRSSARRAITTLIAEHRLDIAVWFIRDLVATARFRASQLAARVPRRDRHDVARAADQAEWAVLAIATETWLPSADRDLLCAPFYGARSSGALRLV